MPSGLRHAYRPAALARRRLTFASALLLVAGVVVLAHARPAPAAWVWIPDPDADAVVRLEGPTWIAEGTGFALRVRRLEPEERRDYLRRVAGTDVDPFAAPDPRAGGFPTFLVELDNRAAGSVLFQPESCSLTTNRHEIHAPLGLEQLDAAYGMLGQELPQAYRRVLPALLQGSRTLAPGERLAGLLVFPTLDERTRAFHLDLRYVLPSGEPVSLAARYRRETVRTR